MSLADIKQMSLVEKIRLMEQLWDSLKAETPEIDSPSWHKDVLEARQKAVAEGKVKRYTIKEVKQQLG